ncbi:DUF1772 domain-containing protein [Pyxidicoccus fallax]|uniref:DUF1772 domain-containing protein n=1 Tax=Pyxidicoccus fallax TaxID=394095 RepID=A0A848LRL6_9BACT|nr:DUF1772 domain-containing protein [Pyxidicoccus fallax]NMO20280.1 DUF1772 domain-containing protein [Pyxidicoccus fallax]NPC81025.1 DUF1772 domain-containing protein [Pyxidicoccus fallax]
MRAASIALALGVFTSGLFSGLLTAVLFLLQKVLKGLSGAEFTVVMQRFLPMARKAPVNQMLVMVSVLAPAAALVLERGRVGSTRFLLTLAGTAVFTAGVFAVSRYAAEPLYDIILGWNARALPTDWLTVRQRYFRINRVRMASSSLAFLMLLLAVMWPERPRPAPGAGTSSTASAPVQPAAWEAPPERGHP